MVWEEKESECWDENSFSFYWLVLMASLEAEERNVYYQKAKDKKKHVEKLLRNFLVFFFLGGGRLSMAFLALGEKVDEEKLIRSNLKIFIFSRMHKTRCSAIFLLLHPTKKKSRLCKHWKIENSPRETVGFYFNWKQFRLVLLWLDVCSLRFLYFWPECFSLSVSCRKSYWESAANPFLIMELFVVFMLYKKCYEIFPFSSKFTPFARLRSCFIFSPA